MQVNIDHNHIPQKILYSIQTKKYITHVLELRIVEFQQGKLHMKNIFLLFYTNNSVYVHRVMAIDTLSQFVSISTLKQQSLLIFATDVCSI